MIRRADIDDRVREWGLRADVVEKDYVLGWVLWGVGTEPVLSERWIFKGGTCLKKCYLETYRFSEDLDFTRATGGSADQRPRTTVVWPFLFGAALCRGVSAMRANVPARNTRYDDSST
jgi:hypothetical protein